MTKLPRVRKNKNQKGFTLIEILIGLGVIAVLSILAFVIYKKVHVSSQANTAQNNITTIAAGIDSLYAGTHDYTNLTVQNVIDAKIAPENMVDAAQTGLVSAFGGNVTIGPDANTNAKFDITYPQVPSVVCQRLAASLGASFDDVQVAGATVMTNGKPDPSIFIGACNGSDPVSMTFVSN